MRGGAWIGMDLGSSTTGAEVFDGESVFSSLVVSRTGLPSMRSTAMYMFERERVSSRCTCARLLR